MVDAHPDLLTLVRSCAARRGDAPTLHAGGELHGANALARRVEAVAAGLRDAGMRPGDRVVVLLPRGADEAVTLLAVAAAGGLAVPIHARLKDAQVAHVLADSEPFAVVTSATRTLALRDSAALLRNVRTFTVGLPPPGVDVDGPLPSAAAGGRDLPAPAPEQPAVLLYTSGSTGLAKGVVQDHRNLALGASIVAGYLALTPEDHVLALLPFAFDYGLNQLLSALHAGCRVTTAEPVGVGELALLLRQHRPTGLAGVPSFWHEVAAGLRSGALQGADGGSLRYVTNSGGALRTADSAVLRACWPRVQVFAMYGLSEAFRSAFLPPTEFDEAPTSFGRALPGVELLLVDPASGAVLDGPATGELVHAGALVAHGYWRRPEQTAQRFRADPRGRPGRVVFSGDLVRRDEHGRHYFVARTDRLLKVSGHRISPDEVAAAVAGMAGVGEVAVFGVDGGDGGHRIVLCAAGDPDDAALRAAVQRRCRAELPSYMQPAAVHVLRTLPHTPNGKVDEGALRVQVGGVHRAALITLLQRYVDAWPDERGIAERFVAFVRAHEDCLERTCVPGHVTASAWIVDAAGERALLTHHRKLGRWLQLGGHVDGEPLVERAALREAREESGMDAFTLVRWHHDLVPLDLDVHPIPARGSEPGHDHWDVRFWLRAHAGQELVISPESVDLRWFRRDELAAATAEESVVRLQRKVDALSRR